MIFGVHMRLIKTCATVMLMLLMVGLAACSKDNVSGGTLAASDKAGSADGESNIAELKEDDGVYIATIDNFELTDANGEEVHFSCYKNGEIYGTVYKYIEEIKQYADYIKIIDAETGKTKGDDIELIDNDGNHIVVSMIAPVDDQELAVLANFYTDNHEVCILYLADKSGNIKAVKALDEVPGLREDAYAGKMISDGTYVYVLYDGKLLAFDRELNYKKTVLESDYVNFCVGNDNLLYIMDSLGNGKLSSYDAVKDKYIEEVADFPMGNAICPGIGDELLVESSSFIRSYNVKTGESTKLFDFTDVGFTPQVINSMYRDKAGDIHILYYELGEKTVENEYGGHDTIQTMISKCALLKRFDKSEVPETEEIRIACNYYNDDVRKVINEFNLSHSDVKIKIKAYSEEYSDDEAMQTAMEQDIINREDYDIYCLYSSDVKKYSDKGLFDDLMSYIENDPSFDMSEYYENGLLAMKEGDKLYGIVTDVMLGSLVGDVTVFGDKECLTLEDIIDARKKYPDISFMSDATDLIVVSTLINLYDYTYYLGGELGTYNFYTKEFRALCELARTFPKSSGDGLYMYASGLVDSNDVKLLTPVYYGSENVLLSRAAYGKMHKSYGAPSTTGNGYFIHPVKAYCINANSTHKEEAWKIIKNLLDAKPDWFGTQFRVNKELFMHDLENMYDQANADYPGSVTMGGVTYTLSMSKEDISLIEQMMSGAQPVNNLDGPVYDIMTEELPAYFAGEKSLDDVIGIMQKRVNLYLEESR